MATEVKRDHSKSNIPAFSHKSSILDPIIAYLPKLNSSLSVYIHLSKKSVLSHQMGVFQWVWFKKSEHHSIMWEDFNRHRKKSNKILFEWWYFLSIFICIFYIGLSLFCEKILKCHFFLFFPAIFSPVSFNLLNGIQKKYYFYIHWNISIYKFKCVSIKYKI